MAKSGKEQTEKNPWDGIVFIDSVEDRHAVQYAGRVLHLLCTAGSMSFTFQDVHYNITPGDYVILPNMSLASGFSASPDCRTVTFVLSEPFVASLAVKSNYGIIGHLALLQNPVMRLSPHDFGRLHRDLDHLRLRWSESGHLFREEMLGHLLMAHILDLYDIHARQYAPTQATERATLMLRQFIGMLYNGAFIRHRDVPYYASRLCITPHYLTETCKKMSGKPATFWIDRFTLHEAMRLLRQKELSLTEIAERLNFSSLSYFSRYVLKRTGKAPSEHRSQPAAGQEPDTHSPNNRKKETI